MVGWGLTPTSTAHGGERIPYTTTLEGITVTPKFAPRICPRGHVVNGTNKYNPDNCRACRIAAKRVREKQLPTELIQRISDELYAEMVKEHPKDFERMSRCLYSKCLFAGEEIAHMGKGFTFCAPHAQIALRVLQKQREANSMTRT